MDTGTVRIRLRNASGKGIRDNVEFKFVNQTLRRFDRLFEKTLTGGILVTLARVPTGPRGIYQVFVSPERYRSRSFFLNARSTTDLDFTLFIRPSQAKVRFLGLEILKTENHELSELLSVSNIGPDEYDALTREEKGGLFNLQAKMRDQEVAEGSPDKVFSFIREIVAVRQDRLFCRVDPDLLTRVQAFADGFHEANGTLHDFSKVAPGFSTVKSFKTREPMGNLQLTFAKNAADEFMVDADLDDHQGIEHALDVLKHRFSGGKTHPFDIHQVLTYFQGIDPGYRLF